MPSTRPTVFGLRIRVLALILMVAAPLIMLLLIEAFGERDEAAERAEAWIASLARESAAQEDDALQQARTLVLTLARVAEVREALLPGGDATRCRALLAQTLRDHRPIARLAVSASNGQVVCGSHEVAPGMNFADRDWFAAAIAPGAPAVVTSRVLLSRQLGQPTVVVAAASPPGVINASLGLDWFTNLASRYPQSGDAIAGIVDPASGELLAHSNGWTDQVGRVLPDSALLTAIRQRPAGGSIAAAGVDGRKQIIGFAPLPGPAAVRAVVFVGLAQDVVLASSNERVARSLAVTLSGLAAALIIGSVLARRVLLRPIRLLADAARGIGQGRLDLRTAPALLGAAEFRGLGEALNAMAESLEQQRRALARSEELYRVLAENTGDVVMLLDPAFNQQYVSPAARETLGYDAHAMLGGSAFEHLHPTDLPAARLAMRALAAGEPALTLEARCIRRDRQVIWAQIKINRLQDGRGYVATLRDITDSHNAEEDLLEANRLLETMAGQDALTGVANRRRFDEMLLQEWRRALRDGSSIALLLIDIDHFKALNDRHGHQAGDHCLRIASAAITDVLRRTRDMVARYGGEEFAVILPSAAPVDAMAVAERIRTAVRDTGIAYAGAALGRLTVSVGVACAMPMDAGEDPAALVHHADQALYEAKRLGRDRVMMYRTGQSPVA